MSSEDNSDSIKSGTTIAAELIKAASDDPNIKEAGGGLGKTALTITKAVNHALMPIAAVNFAFDKAKEYFSTKFQGDISEKLKDIPSESLIEPKASIAGPTLQGLAFSHDEDGLKEMYLNLLAAAMNQKTAAKAHPAFVEIIKQLSANEIILLGHILKSSLNGIPLVEIRVRDKENTNFTIEARNLIDVHSGNPSQRVEDPNVCSQIDNWVRLGLVSAGFDKKLAGDESYKWVEERPEYKRINVESRLIMDAFIK